MTFNYRTLSVVALLSSTVLLGMRESDPIVITIDSIPVSSKEKKKELFTKLLFNDVKKATLTRIMNDNNQQLENSFLAIKNLACHEGWEVILNSKHFTGLVLNHIDNTHPRKCYSDYGFGFFICSQLDSHLYKEIGAVLLGTPGAIKFGKQCIEADLEARDRLRFFLFNLISWKNELRHPSYEDVDIVKAGLDMGLDLQRHDDLGHLFLVEAAKVNKVKVVELLLDRGAHTESRVTYPIVWRNEYDRNSVKQYMETCTALHIAAQRGHSEVVDLLIKRNAHINVTDFFHRTPLMLAGMGGYVETVKKLLAAKADVSLRDKSDSTVLYHVEDLSLSNGGEKYAAIVQLLKDAGAER